MRALLVTGTYPTKERPSAGIFVRNQYQYMKRQLRPGERLDLFCMHTYDTQRRFSHLKTCWALVRFLPYLFRRYDVVHVHFLSSMLYAGWLYKLLHPRTRLLFTLHGSGLKRVVTLRERAIARYRRVLKSVDHVIAAGPTLVPIFRKRFDRHVDQVLCAGVDLQHFFPEPPDVKEYDFIYVGSFEPEKGLDIMLDALALLTEREIKACFVGSGSLAKRLQRAGHNLYIDVYHDVPQRKLRHLYNAARYLVFPSRGDGFGLVVSEAMYCGTPAIVFAGSGAQEQVRHNFNGLIYKPNTPEKLAKVLTDAFEAEGQFHRSLVQGAIGSNKQFALQVVCEELLALYRGEHPTATPGL